MIALIDADVLLYRYSWACQDDIPFDVDDPTIVTSASSAKKCIDEHIEMILDETDCEDFVCCLSSPVNFRKAIFPQYKSNRTGPKPELLSELREWLTGRYTCFSFPGLEADDLLGIMATEDPEGTVVCTIDKDLDQIPGQHYNWNTGASYKLSLAQADRWFYAQALSGDPTDGIPGCPKIGTKRAQDRVDGLIADMKLGFAKDLGPDFPDRMWQIVVAQYAAKACSPPHALLMARLVRILRRDEFDKDRGVKLWTPDGSTEWFDLLPTP
jgi:hypothetical protein